MSPWRAADGDFEELSACAEAAGSTTPAATAPVTAAEAPSRPRREISRMFKSSSWHTQGGVRTWIEARPATCCSEEFELNSVRTIIPAIPLLVAGTAMRADVLDWIRNGLTCGDGDARQSAALVHTC